jgi:hypothetical protein
MNPFLFLLIVHGMAAIGLLAWSAKYGLSTPWKWGVSGLVLGLAPFGVLAWITRDDWGIGNKIIGFLILVAFELGILYVTFSVLK